MKKYSFFILCLFLFLFSCDVTNDNTNNEDNVIEDETFTRIIACSDFQGEKGHYNSEENMSQILLSIEEDGIDYADGFFCCGDYDYEYVDSANGIGVLKNFMSYYVNEGNMVLAQGNHDEIPVGTDGLADSGDNDPDSDKYGVFVINEDDYMWYNNNENTIKNTADKLEEYLTTKLNDNFDAPIFIVSHLALNYSMRTFNDGDGQYAKYIFDVINEAGKNGLNIFYLFGHNHSNGWDDYLGGSSVYLTKGDNILIAENSKTSFESYELNFTYLNAGYIGYYRNVNAGADTELTMTVFNIYSDRVEISRYDSLGKHNLKSMGVSNSYKNETLYEPNLKVYASPQIVMLNS